MLQTPKRSRTEPKKRSYRGNPNNGGTVVKHPGIESYDAQKGIINNSHHAINRKRK